MNRFLFFALQTALFVTALPSAHAQSIHLRAVEDTWIDASAPDIDNGTESILEADGDPLAVALIRWDLTALPSPAFVTDAHISVQITNGSVDAFDLFALPKPWDEAEPTDASRRGMIPLGTLTAPSSGTHRIPLTEAGLQVVQYWIDRPEDNFGLALAPASGGTDGIELASSEAAVPEWRPTLEIQFVTSQVIFTNRPPDGHVTVDRPSGSAPLTVAFSALASTDPEGGSLTVEWAFGDDATATGMTTENRYTVPGSYTATARLTDDLGATTVLPIPIQVREPDVETSSLSDGMTDTKIKADAPTTVHGLDPNLEVDGDPDYATLLRWDLSGIPEGVTITDARLDIQISNTSGDAYPVYALRRAWNEAETTWEQAEDGTPWEMAGAQGPTDRAATPVAEFRPTTTGPRTLSFNEAGVALFQQWVDQPETNFGVIAQEYQLAADGVDFFSSNHPDVAMRPVLRLSWTVPEPPPSLPPPPLSLASEPGSQPGAWSFTATTSDDATVTWYIGTETFPGRLAQATFEGAGVHTARAIASRTDGGLATASTTIRLQSGRWSPVELGIQKPLQVNIVSVYPNPVHTSGTARVELPASDTVEIGLYDLLGRRVWTTILTTDPEQTRDILLPVDRLARGAYVLTARSRTGNGADSHLFTIR